MERDTESKVTKSKNFVVNYVQESFEELRKVTWPTKNQAVKLTFLVLGICLVTAVFIGAIDFVFSYGHQQLIKYAPASQTTANGVTATPVTATPGAVTSNPVKITPEVTTTSPSKGGLTVKATSPNATVGTGTKTK